MKNSSWRSLSFSAASLVAALTATSGMLSGCGGDDTDVEQGGGPATGSTDGGGPRVVESTLPMEFAVSCTESVTKLCAEFLGEKADAEKIKASAAMSCKQGGEELKDVPCPREKLVGTCLTLGNAGGVKRWYKRFFYEPKTVAEAKSICMAAKFEPAQ